MLGGGFGVHGPFVFRIKAGEQLREKVSRQLLEVVVRHRAVDEVVYE